MNKTYVSKSLGVLLASLQLSNPVWAFQTEKKPNHSNQTPAFSGSSTGSAAAPISGSLPAQDFKKREADAAKPNGHRALPNDPERPVSARPQVAVDTESQGKADAVGKKPRALTSSSNSVPVSHSSSAQAFEKQKEDSTYTKRRLGSGSGAGKK